MCGGDITGRHGHPGSIQFGRRSQVLARKYFGTDGIRGRVGEAPITADFALQLGRAVGAALGRESVSSFLIGKDTRISGYMFESALEAGLSAAGADIKLLGPMPTPAIAYLTRTTRACGGIVISASHNPYYDNGFKFFSDTGEKLSDDQELAIEVELDKGFSTVAPDQLGKAERVDDARGRYIEFCKSTFPRTASLNGLKAVVDCANGATYYVGPRVLSELGAEVVAIGVSPDGLNINQGVGSTDLGSLSAAVLEHQADLGIAFDGDGDRVMMVDEHGQTVNGDELIFIVARARAERQTLGGGVVGTLMSNFGMEVALRELGIEFVRAKVGDRYVHQELIARGWRLGGEASGHILSLDQSTTGDGIISALQVLEVLVDSGKSLSTLRAGMQQFPQVMINVPVAGVVDLDSSSAVRQGVERVEQALSGQGRVILRPSGTEPLVRVTVEGRDANQVRRLTEQLAQVVTEEFA